ncbi:lymphocyte antigen 6B-like [Sinocyclocheilus rhinocerous]|uniref:lymphocyte antigen 6B-like n=1 Tax=Sinocyclocheilus rhinocerous TaxID=307959 RepID=UPI0007BA591F|nr:PREDICTED: lymphocyte antigen 6B-like [Sinocyclocheilus rhinocerous]
MDLQISVFLLFVLFTAGHSLRCYECLPGSCADQNVTTCPSGFSKCMSSTTVTQAGPIKVSIKIKLCVPTCEAGTQQLPTGGTITTQCCDTDLCNAADGVYKGSFLLLLSPLLFYFLFQ